MSNYCIGTEKNTHKKHNQTTLLDRLVALTAAEVLFHFFTYNTCGTLGTFGDDTAENCALFSTFFRTYRPVLILKRHSHRVNRVPEFLAGRLNWLPHPHKRVCPPRIRGEGGIHSRLR
jgi:hypothetical protein